MILVYNILQLISLVVLFPLLLIIVVLSPKYKGRIPKRLGFGLRQIAEEISNAKKGHDSLTIWVHALSVGEVTSSLSLVKALRQEHPQSTILFSASTKTGEELAEQELGTYVDIFISFPFDVYWVVCRFIRNLSPDLFVLIETDFWPNFIHILRKKKIRSLLVNGRFSQKSHNNFLKLRVIFAPLFSSFNALTMQTVADAERLQQIGVPESKVFTLGNLKYDSMLSDVNTKTSEEKDLFEHFKIDPKKVIIVAGSTHRGEEEIIISAYRVLKNKFPELYLVIAPRQINRAGEIQSIAQSYNYTASLRTDHNTGDSISNNDMLILNTIGELKDIYNVCSIAFIGGSLVPEGGHNPLEAVILQKAVLFGPNMEDFSEIASDLIQCGGAITVEGKKEFIEKTDLLLSNPDKISLQVEKAIKLIEQHRGIAKKHVELVSKILND